ncbi:MAG: amidohydrolase family protein [Acidobacteriaceae bacterium]
MKQLILLAGLLVVMTGCKKQETAITPSPAASVVSTTQAATGTFTNSELKQFVALNPIDAHTHIYRPVPELYALLQKLNLHLLDILVVDDAGHGDPDTSPLPFQSQRAWAVVHGSDGHIALCTTFDPFKFNNPDFAARAIHGINQDFADGAIAVKIWKNVGMEIKDTKGNYILPDNPALEPIYKDIAAHHKTLIAHLADPDTIWAPPNPNAPDYHYYTNNPELYMYNKPGAPSKKIILQARDRIVAMNPGLRVVGAHLGSMETDFDGLGARLDRYPNFAVDMAARLVYIAMLPRDKAIVFITKYQDRLIYGTDDTLPDAGDAPQETVKEMAEDYARDWRFLATSKDVIYHGKKVQGLALPLPILHKLYHDNAVKWFPGILGRSQ